MNELSNIVLEQADRLFQQHATKDTLAAADRGEWPDSLWHAVDEAGLTPALVPEESGGVGLGSVDVANLIRRAAYYSVPLPLAETMIANQLWVEAGGEVLTGAVTLAPSNPRERPAGRHRRPRRQRRTAQVRSCCVGSAFLSSWSTHFSVSAGATRAELIERLKQETAEFAGVDISKIRLKIEIIG